MKKEVLNRLSDKGILSPLDLHFARFMAKLAGKNEEEVSLAAALVSSHRREGHICLDLSSLDEKRIIEGDGEMIPVLCPELRTWRARLMESGVVGEPGEFKPLVLDGHSRLYLHRYWNYEDRLAHSIRCRLTENDPDIDLKILKEGLDRLFPADRKEEIDWQKVAAFAGLKKRFCVITGGPGTGKTTTVIKILALLLEQGGPERCRIALAAPTGKGAMRLLEALRNGKKGLKCTESIKKALPEEASTIHRLLGSIPGSSYFRHHADRPLPFDVVVLDEASMVDLALMSKLLQALPPASRLILLGDKDQLSSVEAGAVLGDICDRGSIHPYSRQFCDGLKETTGYEIDPRKNRAETRGLQDSIIELRKSYRFMDESDIMPLCLAVNEGDVDLSIGLLKAENHGDIEMAGLTSPADLYSDIRSLVLRGFADYLESRKPLEILRRFERFRILCALREGPYGVVALNGMVEQTLLEKGVIKPEGLWYAGRPVLITRNDYDLRLFNGDVGVLLPDPDRDHGLRAFFPGPDNTLRKFHPLRLPEHETVYAMTVHKSQGSEFDEVLLVLSDRDSPVLTRELLYTGISRARKRVRLRAPVSVFRTMVSRRVERGSGLRDALWGATYPSKKS